MLVDGAKGTKENGDEGAKLWTERMWGTGLKRQAETTPMHPARRI
jgi:hypothetical protein